MNLRRNPQNKKVTSKEDSMAAKNMEKVWWHVQSILHGVIPVTMVSVCSSPIQHPHIQASCRNLTLKIG